MGDFTPIASSGVTKYGPKGLFNQASFSNFNIDSHYTDILKHAANHSLAKKSWSAYKTAGNMLGRCAEETGCDMSLPLAEKQVLLFIAWLIERGLKSRTISSYLSGIRMAHLSRGVYIPILRSDLVKQILDGRLHLDHINSSLDNKPRRLPVTPTILRLLKIELKAADYEREDKRLLWSIATLAFAGGFRIHELLSVQEDMFDPLFTLLGSDVTLKPLTVGTERVETLQIKLKSQKSDRVGVDCIVDVYESKGEICPVKAFKKWKQCTTHYATDLPTFRLSSGKPLTGRRFNKYLKSLLKEHIDYKKGSISSHSFRAGIATIMGQLGYADQEIQALGRWSSRAFEAYLKLPRTKRITMAKAIGSLAM